jgi:protein TonB
MFRVIVSGTVATTRSLGHLLLVASCLATPIGIPTADLARQIPSQPPVRVGAIAPPQKIKDVKPIYPPEAQRANVQGVIVVELTIGPDGRVTDARILRSIPLLDQAALDAVRQWEYTPVLLNGVAITYIMTATVNFTLQGAADATGATGETIRLASITRQPGVTTVWEITPERAGQQPRWNPETSPPPMSIEDAASKALSWLRPRNQDVGPFELQNVMLTRRRGPGMDFWYYQLDFVSAGTPPLRVVVLEDGSIVEPRVEPSGQVNSYRQPAVASPPPPGVYRFGPDVSAPRALKQVQPQYTNDAMRAKIQGTVAIECIVRPDGSVSDLHVVRSLEPTLDQEALKALNQWRFAPGMKDGRAVPVMMTVEMSFNLK